MSARVGFSDSALASFAIDRSSPIPLYFQVATHLEQAISSGAVPPGTLFQNEIELAEAMGVSRPTMRKAMEHLVAQGLIIRRRGIGTRVVQPKVRRPLELTSLYDDLAGTGQAPATAVLELERQPAGPEVALHLGLDEADVVVRVVRLRSARDQPIAKMTNYLPEDIADFGAEDLAERGLYDLLRRQGVQLFAATQIVGARPATPAEAELLQEPRGAALLTMQRETVDVSGRTVEFASHIYAGSRYSLETHLVHH